MVQVDGQDGARAEPLRYKIVHANPDANYEAWWAAGAALVRELSTEPLARRVSFANSRSFAATPRHAAGAAPVAFANSRSHANSGFFSLPKSPMAWNCMEPPS